MENQAFDYYRGDESSLFSFYRIPLVRGRPLIPPFPGNASNLKRIKNLLAMGMELGQNCISRKNSYISRKRRPATQAFCYNT